MDVINKTSHLAINNKFKKSTVGLVYTTSVCTMIDLYFG